MKFIRQITREVTETKERMVPETYKETSTQDFFVLEISVNQLNDMIRYFQNCGHHASNTLDQTLSFRTGARAPKLAGGGVPPVFHVKH